MSSTGWRRIVGYGRALGGANEILDIKNKMRAGVKYHITWARRAPWKAGGRGHRDDCRIDQSPRSMPTTSIQNSAAPEPVLRGAGCECLIAAYALLTRRRTAGLDAGFVASMC